MVETSKTVLNAFKLLSCFTREDAVHTISTLARRLEMSRTGTLRLVATLETAGVLERDTYGRGFRIGVRAFELGALYVASRPLNDLLTAALNQLAAKTRCTAYVGILEGDEVIALYYREGTVPARVVVETGSHWPCTTTAIGKAILMHFPTTTIDEILGKGKNRRLRRLTKNSLRTRCELDKELAITRRRGWSLARGEAHPSLAAIGAAITDTSGWPVAGISLSFLDEYTEPERLKRLGTLICATAKELSAKFASYQSYSKTFTRSAISGTS